jgi:AraC-like DNA-binding protein
MSRVVPLIRAAALYPMIRSLRLTGRPVTERLAAAGLPYLREDEPFQTVPLLACVAFFEILAREEAPDAGCRAVTPETLLEVAIISRVGLGAATPREALMRIAAAMPCHCTHEHFTLADEGDGVVMRDRFPVAMAPAVRHLVQQYVAMMALQICALTAVQDPRPRRIVLMPHPALGVAHLVPWLGPGVEARPTDTLAVTVDPAVADSPFRQIGRSRSPDIGVPVANLRGNGTLAASIRQILPLLLDGSEPLLDRVAAAAGLSRRTLQRLLAQEHTSLSDLVEETRRAEALRRLSAAAEPLRALSSALGYSQQSALTRAVRRWTGTPPSRLRMDRTG